MAEPIHGPTSHSYFSQRLRLHYVDWGNADAPPMILVHGGRDHCRNWDWVAEALRNDYHIIAPDLRGHGDSQWMVGGGYMAADYIYDIAQLLHQTKLTPVTIIGHSLGAAISLRYAGLYPENAVKVVAIEGVGRPPELSKHDTGRPASERMREWVDTLRSTAGRNPREYDTLEDAWQRMQEANPHLTPEQARHLTVHGVNQNEDGTYSWKFDNYIRVNSPFTMGGEATRELWSSITCPTLLIHGTDSWATDPRSDGRDKYFQNVEVAEVKDAGHWVHHDQLDVFLNLVRNFLAD